MHTRGTVGHKGLEALGLKFEGKSSWMHGSGWCSPLTEDINRAQSERGATGGPCLQRESKGSRRKMQLFKRSRDSTMLRMFEWALIRFPRKNEEGVSHQRPSLDNALIFLAEESRFSSSSFRKIGYGQMAGLSRLSIK